MTESKLDVADVRPAPHGLPRSEWATSECRDAGRSGRFPAHTWIAVLLALLLPSCGSADRVNLESNDGAPEASGSNIVFVLTDDLDLALYERMDRLRELLEPEGTVFTQHIVSISLCCPSRVTTLTGRYAHNTGIFHNRPPDGGFQAFHDLGGENTTLATLLDDAGYNTVLMGKHLNFYPGDAGETYVPPGWDEWYSPVLGEPHEEYDYTLNENGRLVSYGHEENDYMVDVLAEKAARYIDEYASSRPFFMYIAPYKPHSPATPPERYRGAFSDERAPRTPAFDEVDVTDKPPWIANLSRLSEDDIEVLDRSYRKRMRSMLAITDLVETVLDALTGADLIDTTDLVFTSDHGYHMGQHRLHQGKNTAYDEDLLVPLVVRGPHAGQVRQIDQQTANIDYAPTFLDWAGVSVPDDMDGMSFQRLLEGRPSEWRDAVLLEHRESDTIVWASGDSGTLEPSRATTGSGVRTFIGLRTRERTYIAHETGDIEIYDHEDDPDQLDNAYSVTPESDLAKLQQRTSELRNCSGSNCR